MDDTAKTVEKHSNQRGGIISMLQEIQSRHGYLPQDELKIVANSTGRSLVDIYGIATFYKSFSLTPRGKHLVSVCLGTACHVRNAPIIGEEFERQLGVKTGETTADNKFTLERVNCLGACALGPIVVVDGHYFSEVGTAKVKKILKQVRSGLDNVDVKHDQHIFPVELKCPRCNRSLMDSEHLVDDKPSVRVTASFKNKHGCLWLSCLYGSFNIEAEFKIPLDTVLNIFCPHCHAEIVGASQCTECNAPMIPMIVNGGGMIQLCSRRGCREHMLDLDVESIENIN